MSKSDSASRQFTRIRDGPNERTSDWAAGQVEGTDQGWKSSQGPATSRKPYHAKVEGTQGSSRLEGRLSQCQRLRTHTAQPLSFPTLGPPTMFSHLLSPAGGHLIRGPASCILKSSPMEHRAEWGREESGWGLEGMQVPMENNKHWGSPSIPCCFLFELVCPPVRRHMQKAAEILSWSNSS